MSRYETNLFFVADKEPLSPLSPPLSQKQITSTPLDVLIHPFLPKSVSHHHGLAS